MTDEQYYDRRDQLDQAFRRAIDAEDAARANEAPVAEIRRLYRASERAMKAVDALGDERERQGGTR